MHYLNKCLSIILLIVTSTACNYAPEKKSENQTLRIISLAPSFTEMLYILDAQKNLVGCTSYCKTNPADSIQVIASLIDDNAEKVLALKPTVILASTLTKPETLERFTKLGIQVIAFEKVTSYKTIYNQLIQIGKLVGKDSLAKQIVQRENAKIDSLQKTIPVQQKKPKVFFQIGTNPLFTVIPNTFMDDYITLAGGENIANDLTHGTITREAVLLRNPDVILIAAMGIGDEKEKQNWESFRMLNATKNKKIFLVNSDRACAPSPITYTIMLEEIIHLLNN